MARITRRRFLGTTLATAVGSSLPIHLFASPSSRSTRVVAVTDHNAVSGSSVNADVVQTMVNLGIKALTGEASVGEAWLSLFPPGISSSSRISIKENLSNGQVAGAAKTIVQPETTDAMVNGLQAMPLSGGPPPLENILVWDLDKDPIVGCGYTINWGGPGLQCYYAVQNYGWWIDYGWVGNGLGFDSTYTCTINHPPNTSHHPTKIITQHTDYMINVGILGLHSNAKVTGVLKNHYGSFTNICINQMHFSGISRGIPALNQYIRDDLGKAERLYMIDGLFGSCTGGPQAPVDCTPQTIILGTDPVAVDYQMTQILNSERAKQRQGPVDPDFLPAAAGPPYDLGTNDPGEIDLVEIIDPYTPQGVGFHVSGEDYVVTWDAVAGANSYKVYKSTDPYSPGEGGSLGTTSTNTFTDIGAANSAGYGGYFVVAEYDIPW